MKPSLKLSRCDDCVIPLSEVDLNNPNIYRAGIIPYVFHSNGHISMIFGITMQCDRVSDFGGGREDYDGDLLDTAIREYNEECYDAISINPTRELLMDINPYVIVSERYHSMDIIFELETFHGMNYIRDKFKRCALSPENVERREVLNIIMLYDSFFVDYDFKRSCGFIPVYFYYKVGKPLRDNYMCLLSMLKKKKRCTDCVAYGEDTELL